MTVSWENITAEGIARSQLRNKGKVSKLKLRMPSDLSVFHKVLSLAFPRDSSLLESIDEEGRHPAERSSTDVFRVLRALSAVFPSVADAESAERRDRYRQLLLSMDRRYVGRSWWEKYRLLQQIVTGHKNELQSSLYPGETFVEASTLAKAGPPSVSQPAPTEESFIALCSFHSTVHHTSNERMAEHQVLGHAAFRPELSQHGPRLLDSNGQQHPSAIQVTDSIAEVSAILPEFSERRSLIPKVDMSTQAELDATTMVAPDQSEELASRKQRVQVVRCFYAWMGYSRALRKRKAELVTQWMVAVKRWQTSHLQKTFRKWHVRSEALRALKHENARRIATLAIHAFSANVNFIHREIHGFRTLHVMRGAFRQWKAKQVSLYMKRCESAIAESVMERRRARDMAKMALQCWHQLTKKKAVLRTFSEVAEQMVRLKRVEVFFRKWEHMTTNVRRAKAFDAMCRHNRAAICLNGWRRLTRRILGAQESARLLKSRLHRDRLRHVFEYWTDRTENRLKHRDKIETSLSWKRKHTLVKCFHAWKWWHDLEGRCRQKEKENRMGELRRVWAIWVSERSKAAQEREKANKHLLRRATSHWRETTVHNKALRVNHEVFRTELQQRQMRAVLGRWRAANAQQKAFRRTCKNLLAERRRNVLKYAMHVWNVAYLHQQTLTTKLKEHESRHRHSRLARHLRLWRVACAYRLVQQSRRYRIVQQSFHAWHQRHMYVSGDLEDRLQSFSRSRLQQTRANTLMTWIDRYRNAIHRSDVAHRKLLTDMVTKAFVRWRDRSLYENQRHLVAMEYWSCSVLGTVIRTWQASAKAKIQHRITTVMEKLQAKRDQRLLRQCLKGFRVIQAQRKEARDLCFGFKQRARQVQKRLLLQHWRSRYKYVRNMATVATSGHDHLLMSKVYWVWISKWRRRQRVLRACRSLVWSFEKVFLHRLLTEWQVVAERQGILRGRAAKFTVRLDLKKLEIVLSTWRLALRFKNLQRLELVIAQLRTIQSKTASLKCWKYKFNELRAERAHRQKFCKRYFLRWQDHWWNALHDRLATRLHQQRCLGTIFRMWIWKTWAGLAPDAIVLLQLECHEPDNGLLSLTNQTALRSRFVTTKIPEQLGIFQRMGAMGRILSMTEVHTPIYADHPEHIAEGDGEFTKWRALIAQLRETTRSRRADYASADAAYRAKLMMNTLAYWHHSQKATKLYRLMAAPLTARHEALTMQASFQAWSYSLYCAQQRDIQAHRAHLFYATRNAFGQWTRALQRAREAEDRARSAALYVCTIQSWRTWRRQYLVKREEQIRKMHEDLAVDHQRVTLMRRTFDALHNIYIAHHRLRVLATRQFDIRCLRRTFEHWKDQASILSLRKRIERQIAVAYNINVTKRAFCRWTLLTAQATACRLLKRRLNIRTVIELFQVWKQKSKKKHNLRRKAEALRNLKIIVTEHKYTRLFKAWRAVVVKQSDIRRAEGAFSARMRERHQLQFDIIPTEPLLVTTMRARTMVQSWRKWTDALRNAKARRFALEKLLHHCWQGWRAWHLDRRSEREEGKNTVLASLAKQKLRQSWHLWVTRVKHRQERREQLLRVHQKSVRKIRLPAYFDKWWRRTATVALNTRSAIQFDQGNVMGTAIARWQQAAAKQNSRRTKNLRDKELEKVAVYMDRKATRRRVFHLWATVFRARRSARVQAAASSRIQPASAPSSSRPSRPSAIQPTLSARSPSPTKAISGTPVLSARPSSVQPSNIRSVSLSKHSDGVVMREVHSGGPASVAQHRVSTAQQRVATTQQQASATHHRVTTTQQRVTTSEQRVSATQQRVSATQQRDSKTQPRVSITQQAPTTQSRLITTQARPSTTQLRVSTAQERRSTAQPGSSTLPPEAPKPVKKKLDAEGYAHMLRQADAFLSKRMRKWAWNRWQHRNKMRNFEYQRKMIFAATWAQKMLKRRLILAWAQSCRQYRVAAIED
ncbi:uncharacterized protein EV422DRAFT_532683 [Fimicolochytrium jonesii]|uniref:uncharacterized protein n=1 Tax=Fimicolochytrium jonesii TaxID=1396493 RepID=UPI0022FEF81E|nr:uncharacterized protein EV422DRAFT_532683 [Fimicolochytrium jonesii]KAI8819897.1 hypothetical protein EV422DRAFT_532683 [Fimicolochytrium jonesii]